MPRDEKYVVLKRKDWEGIKSGNISALEPYVIDDAVVIRLQDLFAGPALHAYAGSIQTALEIMQRMGSEDVEHRLADIRDYFTDCANEADRLQTKKVPD